MSHTLWHSLTSGQDLELLSGFAIEGTLAISENGQRLVAGTRQPGEPKSVAEDYDPTGEETIHCIDREL
jgi:hypothetical protein